MQEAGLWSPRARGRGLKPDISRIDVSIVRVAPRAGAWIETDRCAPKPISNQVAPRAGAWIETLGIIFRRMASIVAPRAGAWIETLCIDQGFLPLLRRPPRGGVD